VWLLALLAGVVLPSPLAAVPIEYIEQAVASGSLGSTQFRNQEVTVTFTGDTTNVFADQDPQQNTILRNEIGTATVNVASIGTATFTAQMGVADALHYGTAGILQPTVASVLDTDSALFLTYDLRSAIGPVSGHPFIVPQQIFPTTLGIFNLKSTGDSTFTAIVTPEPSSLMLAAFGIAGLAAWGWRRRVNR
jgi:hypothetical protein